MKRISLSAAAVFALMLGTSAAAWQAAGGVPAAAGEDDELTLTGCVVRGEGGYVLTNVTATSIATAPRPATVAPAAAAGAMAITPRTLFWLDDDEDLEEYAGHRVEVRGEVEEDIDRGEIEIEREEGMIELEIKAKGEKVTIKLPDTYGANEAVGTSGIAVTDRPQDVEFIVRKFDVEEVKSLASVCATR